MISIAGILSTMSITMHTCLIMIDNDTDSRILIRNQEDGVLISLAKYEKRRFGSADRRACFDVYIQESGKRVIPMAYTCEQNICSNDTMIVLKLSDIKNKTDATKFFTITQHEPHASMAQKVTEHIRQCEMCE